jgi:hypothetical protein
MLQRHDTKKKRNIDYLSSFWYSLESIFNCKYMEQVYILLICKNEYLKPKIINIDIYQESEDVNPLMIFFISINILYRILILC